MYDKKRNLWDAAPANPEPATEDAGPTASIDGRPRPPRALASANLIAVLLLLGILTVISGNSASIRADRDGIAALQRRQSQLEDDQGRAHIAALEKRVETLEADLRRIESGRSKLRSASILMLTQPASVPFQTFKQRWPEGNDIFDEPDETIPEDADIPSAGLPRYERSISPDGRLILRKMQ